MRFPLPPIARGEVRIGEQGHSSFSSEWRTVGLEGSYDKLNYHGHWPQVRAARIYFDSAMQEAGSASIPKWGTARLARCNVTLSTLFLNNVLIM